MNYFDQLLESYTRLKKRTLSLLEEGGLCAAPSEQEEGSDAWKTATEKASSAWSGAVDYQPACGPDGVSPPGCVKGGDPLYKKAKSGGPLYIYKQATGPKQGKTSAIGGPYGERGSGAFTSWGEVLATKDRAAYCLIRHFYETDVAADGDIADAADEERDLQPGAMIIKASTEILGDTPENWLAGKKIQEYMTNIQSISRSLAERARLAGEESYFAGWTKTNVTDPKTKKVTGDSWGYTDLKSIDRFVAGNSPQSISRAIVAGRTVKIGPEGLTYTDLPRDLDLMVNALDSMNALFDLGGRSEFEGMTDVLKKCQNLSNRVRRDGKKLIFLSNAEGSQGIVMPENDLLTYASTLAAKRCDTNIEMIPKEYNSATLNAHRGPAFETGTVVASLLDNPNANLTPAVEKEISRWVAKETLKDAKKFDSSMAKLNEFLELDAATDVESLALISTMEKLQTQTGTPKQFKAFLITVSTLRKMQEDSLKLGADMAFTVAKEKGVGYSDDVIDLFYKDGKNRAIEARRKLGLLNPENVESVTMGELKEKDADLAKIYQQAYNIPDDNAVIYTAGEGLKAYFNPTEITAGQVGRWQRRNDLIMQAGDLEHQKQVGKDGKVALDKEGNAELAKDKNGNLIEVEKVKFDDGTDITEYNPGFAQTIKDNLWGTDRTVQETNLAEVRSYQKELNEVFTVMNKVLPNEGVYTNEKKEIEEVTYDTFFSIMDTEIKNLGYTDNTKNTVSNILQESNGQSKNLSDNNVRYKVRDELFRVLLNAKQFSDMNSKDVDIKRKARNNFAYNIQMFGGVKHDSAISVMGIDDKSTLVTSHQKIANKYTKGLIMSDEEAKKYPDKVITPSLGGAGFSTNLKDTKDNAVSVRTTRGSTHEKGSNSETFIYFSNGALKSEAVLNTNLKEHEAKKTQDPEALNNSLLVNFLQGQAKLLENLLSTQ